VTSAEGGVLGVGRWGLRECDERRVVARDAEPPGAVGIFNEQLAGKADGSPQAVAGGVGDLCAGIVEVLDG
jgi:hypothetical protein